MDILSFPHVGDLRRLTRKASEASSREKILESLLLHILRERALERHPLFVLGAGISSGEVPLLWELSAHLITKLEASIQSTKLTPDQRSILVTLRDLGQRVAEGKALRSDAAEFFFSLQGAAPPLVKDTLHYLWQSFSVDLLTDNRIPRPRGPEPRKKTQQKPPPESPPTHYKALPNATPTPAHNWIATQVRQGHAWCLSFNFDRLTGRALRRPEHGSGCAVLYRAEQIQDYFTASKSLQNLPAVFKVRGDVFYATCSEGGCSLHRNPLPLHALPATSTHTFTIAAQANPKAGETAPTPLFREDEELAGVRCPECQVGALLLQLSFPGFRAKEEEAFPVLEAVSTFLHHRTSAIIIIGLSGHWDDYVLEFLSNLAYHWAIPIVDVKPDALDERNPIRDYVRSFPDDLIYFPFPLLANQFAEKWAAIETSVDSRQASYDLDEPRSTEYADIGRDLPGDGLWLNEESGNRLEIRSGGHDDALIQLDMNPIRNRYLGPLLPRTIKARLSTSAQLAIDNMVITGEPGTHDRWHHSLGAVAVALAWYRKLASLLDLKEDTRRNDEQMLAVALALHDYGHLPFSHLSEQVIEEINWRPRLHSQFGSEVNVLAGRLRNPPETAEREATLAFLSKFEKSAGLPPEGGVPVLLRLISGSYARPYLAAIVNSPIDADKIDYLIRDVFELDHRGHLGFQSRLPHQSCREWLSEFLADQTINGCGLLCLNGRSAVAIRDLLEERMFLYRALYRSPEVRGAERIAIEFVRQFAIVRVWEELRKDPKWMTEAINGDLRTLKNQALQRVLLEGYETYSEEKEWAYLSDIVKQVLGFRQDPEYLKLLEASWDALNRMKGEKSLRFLRGFLREGFLVGTPLYFQKEEFSEVRRIIRPLQHQYCCDVLFDLVALPQYLSDPPALNVRLWENRPAVGGCNILVPEGRADSWSYGAQARVPLNEEAFDTGSSGRCMVHVYDPFLGRRPQAYYAFDKLWAACRSEGLKPISGGL